MTSRTRRSTVRWEKPVCRAIAASVTPAAIRRRTSCRGGPAPRVRARPAGVPSRQNRLDQPGSARDQRGWRTSSEPPPAGSCRDTSTMAAVSSSDEDGERELSRRTGLLAALARGPAAPHRLPAISSTADPVRRAHHQLGAVRRDGRLAVGAQGRREQRLGPAGAVTHRARTEVRAALTISALAECRSSREVQRAHPLGARAGPRTVPGRTPG